MVYGQTPPTLLSYVPRIARVDVVAQTLTERDQLMKEVRLKLQQAQNRKKLQYDRRHQERIFQPGDQVYVRLQPYRQQTVERRTNMKLAARYYGPFQVLERVRQVAYRLEFPVGSRVHPVFHVSLLKLKLGNHETAIAKLPEATISPTQPQAVLAYRGKGGKAMALIHWCRTNLAEATWENIATIKSQFPNFNLEDKVQFNGGRNVKEAGLIWKVLS